MLPMLGVFLLFLTPSNNSKLLKLIALNFSSLPFVGSLVVWAFFKKSWSQFQFVDQLAWFSSINLNITIGLDGISLFFVLLTTLLIPICILLSWNSVKKDLKEYLIAFLLLETFLILVFSILDLLLFYIFSKVFLYLCF